MDSVASGMEGDGSAANKPAAFGWDWALFVRAKAKVEMQSKSLRLDVEAATKILFFLGLPFSRRSRARIPRQKVPSSNLLTVEHWMRRRAVRYAGVMVFSGRREAGRQAGRKT